MWTGVERIEDELLVRPSCGFPFSTGGGECFSVKRLVLLECVVLPCVRMREAQEEQRGAPKTTEETVFPPQAKGNSPSSCRPGSLSSFFTRGQATSDDGSYRAEQRSGWEVRSMEKWLSLSRWREGAFLFYWAISSVLCTLARSRSCWTRCWPEEQNQAAVTPLLLPCFVSEREERLAGVDQGCFSALPAPEAAADTRS